MARNYYETSKGPSSRNLGKKILEEWQKIKQEQQKKEISEEQKQLKQNVETISCVNYINVSTVFSLSMRTSQLLTKSAHSASDYKVLGYNPTGAEFIS